MAPYLSLSFFLDHNTPIYGGSKGIIVSQERSIKKGDTANTKKIQLNNHSGTHVDFPNHFFISGLTSEKYDPDFWIFENPFLLTKKIMQDKIIDISDEEIDMIPTHTDFLIYKTEFGKHRDSPKYWKNNPGFSPSVAEKLRNNFPKLRVLGTDIISITAYQNRELGREAHRKFLGGENPILLIEDMDLGLLKTQPKFIFCAPLLVKGLDSSPINIIAEV